MKKLNIILCIALILTLASCTGQTTQSFYNSTEQHTVKLSAGDKEVAADNENVLNVKPDGMTIKTEIRDEYDATSPTINATLYTDDNGTYGFNGDKLVIFSSDYDFESIAKEPQKSEEELKTITDEILIRYSVNPDDYSFQTSYDKSTKLTRIYYLKMHGEIKTNDFAYICLTPSGKISGFNISTLGILDGVTIPDYDEDKLMIEFMIKLLDDCECEIVSSVKNASEGKKSEEELAKQLYETLKNSEKVKFYSNVLEYDRQKKSFSMKMSVDIYDIEHEEYIPIK